MLHVSDTIGHLQAFKLYTLKEPAVPYCLLVPVLLWCGYLVLLCWYVWWLTVLQEKLYYKESNRKRVTGCRDTILYIYIYIRFEFFTVVTVEKVFSGMLRRVALLRTDVSAKLSASFIRLTRNGELGTTVAVTSNQRTLRRNSFTACSSW
jgi:hypothetical protein